MDSAAIRQSVKLCQSGNPEEFAKLYDAFLDRIYKFVFYRVGHKEVAEDVTSTVFFKALQGIRKFNPDKGEFTTWLYTIARNSVTDHFRSGSTGELPLEEVAEQVAEDSPFENAIRSIDAEKARQFVKELSPHHRDLIVMRLWDGLSHKEMAEILGQSEGSVRTGFSRAVATLKKVYGPAAVLLVMLINPLSN